jgi:DNA excision repair protein ERCC-2
VRVLVLVEDVKFPYPQARKGQVELAESIAEVVRSGGSIVVKAPTGYGKTVSVIYGLLLGGVERVVYLVRTVNEIDPVLKEVRRFGESPAILISARRTCPLMARPGAPPLPHEDFWRNCAILRVKGLCDYYNRIRLGNPFKVLEGVAGYTRGYPLPRALRMLRDMAKHLNVCPFFTMMMLMGGAKFVIATYPYVFRMDVAEEIFGEGLEKLKDYVLVVDEAHSLLNAQSIVERRVTLGDLARAASEIRRYSPQDSGLAAALDGVREDLARLRKHRWSGLKAVDKSTILSRIEYVDELERVEWRIRTNLVLQALISQSQSPTVTLALSRVVEWVKAMVGQDHHLFAQQEGEELSLIVTPLDPMVVVKGPLEKARALVLLSGTIPPGDFLKGFLGVERGYVYFDVEMLYGPIAPRSNMYTVVVADVTSRYRDRTAVMYDRIARYITSIAKSVKGVKLVVYPSYEVMHGVVERLPGELDVIVENPQTSLSDVEAAIGGKGDLLVNSVAGGKLVEGVEFMDYEGNNLLHLVAVVGIPYPQPDDYTKYKLETLSKRMGRKEANNLVYLVSAIIKVRQALGRAIRSPEDRAVFILLDDRYLRRDVKELLSIKYNRVVAGVDEFKKTLEYIGRHLAQEQQGEADNTVNKAESANEA